MKTWQRISSFCTSYGFSWSIRIPGCFLSVYFGLSLHLTILVSELLHLYTISIYQDKGSAWGWARWLAVFVISPFMPAYFIFRHLILTLRGRKLHNKFGMKSHNLQLKAYEEIRIIDDEIGHLQLVMGKIHCNENVLENLTQLTILVLIILTSLSNSSSVENIDPVLMKQDNILTYVLASMTFISMLRGQLNFLKANKNGCLNLKGTMILIPFYTIGTVSR